MTTENDFNRKLSSYLKTYSPLVFTRKLSDKYQVGMSDFMVIHGGETAFIESKWKKELKGPLAHPFSGAQISFMKQASGAGALCFGLIGIESMSKMLLLPSHGIQPSGNFRDFTDTYNAFADLSFPITKDGLAAMLESVFGLEKFWRGAPSGK
jgi:penicillin-binding protein-related factor A (putative recombinase)